MFKTRYQKKQIERICQSHQLRKATKIYKNKVYINQNIFMIDVIKIKTKDDFITELLPLKNWLNNQVYLLEKTNSILLNWINNSVDIIVCDIHFNIIDLHKNVNKKTNIKWPNKSFNIWIAKNGFIDFYNLNLNGYISLKPLSL